MKNFTKCVNWEFVHAHHKKEDGKVYPSAEWVKTIINHAIEGGYKGKITRIGACRVINKNLY